MSIIRGARPSDNFVMIQNAALEDKSLSYKARGLLGYMLSRPPGWTTTADKLAATSAKEGRDAVLSGLKELEKAGYLKREMTSGGRGKWNHDQYVTDTPEPAPDQEVIGTGLDDSVNYDAVKPGSINKTDSNKTEINNTDSKTVLQDTTSPSPTETAVEDDEAEFLKSLGRPSREPDQPDWLTTDGYNRAQSEGARYGFVYHKAIRRYETAVTNGWGGKEKPNTERFTGTWLFMERMAVTTGDNLPGQEVASTPEDLKGCFDQFWEAYPKKERMALAITAFKWAAEQVSPALLINQAKGYARSVMRDHIEPQYIASAHKWLTDRRWTDTYPSGLTSLSRTAADD